MAYGSCLIDSSVSAEQPQGFFIRIATKASALTVLQYFNDLNHKPIGQVKCALF